MNEYGYSSMKAAHTI